MTQIEKKKEYQRKYHKNWWREVKGERMGEIKKRGKHGKITEEHVKKMRYLFTFGERSCKEISEIMGVSYRVVIERIYGRKGKGIKGIFES